MAPLVVTALMFLVAAVARGEGEARPSAGESCQRVSIELEFRGELLAIDYLSQASKRDAADKALATRAPLQVDASIGYDELAVNAGNSLRHYAQAQAKITAANRRRTQRLDADRRLIVATTSKGRRTRLASPDGPMSREDLELIDIVGDAQALDLLLPEPAEGKPRLQEGQEWRVSGDAMAALLGLDSAAICEVRCTVDDANRKYARFQLAGAIHGAIDAAATELEVRAIGLYHRENQQVTQLNIAMSEKREVGPARPGVAGTAKIKITRMPCSTPQELSDVAIASLGEDALDLHLKAARQGFELQHDRQWFLAAESRDSITLHRVADTGLIAQTTLRSQPSVGSTSRPTLESFEKEVRFSLGESFVQLISSEQWVSPVGNYCMGMIVEGTLDGVPLEWRYYMVLPGEQASGDSPEALPTISLVTTVEGALADRVDKADREIANRLQLATPQADAAGLVDMTPVAKPTPTKKVTRRRKVVRSAKQPTTRRAATRRRR